MFPWKDSERLVLQGLLLLERNLEKVNFTNEKFRHKKINNKDAYVDYGATKDSYSLRQCGDLKELN